MDNNQSLSFLQPSKFQLQFIRIPDVVYYCQKINIPGCNVPPVVQSNPFTERKIAGQKMVHESLKISFILDSEMNTWNEIYTWLRNYSNEITYDDYTKLRNPNPFMTGNDLPQPYSDATLTVLSNENTPNLRFIFHDCFPISLSSVDFDVTTTTDNPLTCIAEFQYLYKERIVIPG